MSAPPQLDPEFMTCIHVCVCLNCATNINKITGFPHRPSHYTINDDENWPTNSNLVTTDHELAPLLAAGATKLGDRDGATFTTIYPSDHSRLYVRRESQHNSLLLGYLDQDDDRRIVTAFVERHTKIL